MTVAEIIAEQRRKCEADKAARMCLRAEPAHGSVPPPAKMTPAEIERAYMDDRTYGGKAPEGGMYRTMRRENPEEYVARDGTRTFVPWRYVSMQDLELPSGENPYRKQDPDEMKKPADPWDRPSGYVASTQGSAYDPWAAPSGPGQTQETTQQASGGWDDWLAPTPQPVSQDIQPSTQNSWMAPANMPSTQTTVDTVSYPAGSGGALDLMRSMHR